MDKIQMENTIESKDSRANFTNQMLKVENLSVFIEGDLILDNVSFEVEKGKTFAIIGPNGAGKTTLFKTLLGLLHYQKGMVSWQENVKIGYVPQRIEIEKTIPLTVEEFLKLRTRNVSQKEIEEILESIQLNKNVLKRGLGEVSIGQRQRLFIAWTILEHPDVILFDEPTADVDVYGQESIYKMLSHLQQEFNLTVILISHDLSVVYQYANSVMCLNHKNICSGKPADIINTATMKKLFGEEKGFYEHKH